MSKNVVFTSIFDLTRVQFEIAQSLQKCGHRVFWITTNELWTDWLLDKGVAREDVLQLVYGKNDLVPAQERERLLSKIVAAEAKADVTVNQSLIMDRFVIYKNKPDINEYMLLYYRDIKQFLRDKRADMVFAEPTNCNELVTYIICQELGLPFMSAGVMRYPGRRVIFCRGYDQAVLAVKVRSAVLDPELGRRLIDEFTERQERPSYFNKLVSAKVMDSRKAVRATSNRLKLLNPARRQHLTYHDLSERLGTAARRIANGFYLRHLCRYDRLEDIPGRLAFYPLHVQPEASIDVRGSFFSDQIKLIKDIRRSLPFDVTLVIKEHPNFLGQRGPGFFRKIRRIPNVKIVAHGQSTFDIYRRAAIVFTVTGTAAYEAGLLGIPAVTFAPMFFGGLSSIRHCPDIVGLKTIVFGLLHGFKRDREADNKFMAEIMTQSFEGYWTDPLFDSSVMAPENLQLLSHAFQEVVEGDLA